MRLELERLRLIEQHLLGPARPAADWPLALLLDGELAADAAAQQRLYRGLRAAGQRQLRAELRTIHGRRYGAGRPAGAVGRAACWRGCGARGTARPAAADFAS